MRDAFILARFNGREEKFRLTLGGIEELEASANAGAGAVLMRLVTGQFYLRDITATLRLGLVGAGHGGNEAGEMVDRAIANDPPGTYLQLAADILNKALNGIDPELVPEDAAQGELERETGSASPATSPAGSRQARQPD